MLRSGGVVLWMVTLMILQTSSAQDEITPLIPDSSTPTCDYEISCANECQQRVDSYGCPYCECPLTCESVDCLEGYACEMQEYPCLIPPCPTHPVCVPIKTTIRLCPKVMCARGCVPIRGPNGCLKCVCPPSCQNVHCPKDEYCVLLEVICITFPCFPIPSCFSRNETTTNCTMVECAKGCVRVRGINECPRCVCPQTCQDVNCTKDEKCVLKQDECITFPCFPTPRCVPKLVSRGTYV